MESSSCAAASDLPKPSKILKLWLLFQTLLVTINGEEVKELPEDQQVVSEAIPAPEEEDVLAKVKLPRKLPSIVDIKKAIPAHCFESNLLASLYSMVKDFSLIIVCYLLWQSVWDVMPLYMKVAITPLYWMVQGTLFTAIFVVGHDAGHDSFSSYQLVNDVCGNICHTFLLCPFYMWKLSHRHHHKNTGNIDKDEVFYPVRSNEGSNNILLPGFGIGIGWFSYLVKGYKPRTVEHFNPFHSMFARHTLQCSISLFLLGAWSMVVYHFYETQGMFFIFYHYLVPLFIFGSYTVIITFLHHTEDEIPWYSNELWDNVRGQLSSVDRRYGWCHDIIHNIGTHQIHHLFPKMPHYNLEEATIHFRKAFPDLVNVSNEPILPAFVRMFRKYYAQSIIAPDQKIHIYK